MDRLNEGMIASAMMDKIDSVDRERGLDNLRRLTERLWKDGLVGNNKEVVIKQERG